MYSVKEISNLLEAKIDGNQNEKIKRLAPFYEAKEDDLTFAADEKFLKNLNKTKAKVVIVPDINNLPEGKIYIKVNKSPRELMPKMLNYFKVKLKKIEKAIEDSAVIGVNVKISPNVYIGHNVKIGNNTFIYPNVSIIEGTEIGENCIIYPNVSIREFCKIGNNVIIQQGVCIGSDGFGFIKVNGNNMKIEQIGRVIIEDNVEIGANTCIDRGAIGDTLIKKYTKLDNLIHISHNTIIGENCLMAAQLGIAGSTEVGNNVTIGGKVGINGHIKIGDNVLIAAKSGVTKNIEANSKISGFPAINHMEDLKIKISMNKLPDIMKRLKTIEKKIEQTGENK